MALDGKAKEVEFQYHHQPFNYFAKFAPGTTAREEHIRDGGLNGAAFIKAVDEGKLPQVAFYKPQGNLNEHPGYADVLEGDIHIADLVVHLEKSPQWPNMVVIVTYDENGGFWDHAAPPKGDRWGPGTRIPAIIISPFAKKGTVDHTLYDTTSILRFITRRFDLPKLAGLTRRDEALRAHGEPPLGDLTAALDLPR
jgi:phospholipase C